MESTGKAATAGLVRERRVRRLDIAPTLLTRFFAEGAAWMVRSGGLPPDALFCSLSYDIRAETISLYLASPSWEPHGPEDDIPQVEPVFDRMRILEGGDDGQSDVCGESQPGGGG